MAVKLNLGAGPKPAPGYINIDRSNGQEVYPLPYPDNYADEIRASHILEHFGHTETVKVLDEWYRVLKPGGVMKIAVPDFGWIVERYNNRDSIPTQGYIMGGQSHPDDFHRTVFDRELLSEAMRYTGLRSIREWKSELNDCATLPVSLNLQGIKPGPLPKMKVECAFSVPRLGFQDNFFCWANALMPFGIKPTKYEGAYWGQCLERVMEGLVDDAEWILTVDYDSVFTKEQVEQLLWVASQHPEADAIAPIEVKRGGGTPLMTVRGEDGKLVDRLPFEAFEDDLMKIATAHFGLTLIRVEALKKMPHPWFLGVPNKDGRWEDGKIDDDIYFWREWEKAGNSLYLANRVVIGHAQLLVSWPGRDFEPIHQPTSDFWENGVPKGVWL